MDFLEGVATAEGPDDSKPPPGGMAELQRRLDDGWDTAQIREHLHRSSMEVLMRFLAEPPRERWKRAMFTSLLGQFDQPRMLTGDLRSCFDAAVGQALPGQIRELWRCLRRRATPSHP